MLLKKSLCTEWKNRSTVVEIRKKNGKFHLEDLPGVTRISCSMSTRKLASLEEVILCQCERLPQVTRCNAGLLSLDGVTSRGCFVALAETFNCTADTNRLGISRHTSRGTAFTCLFFLILRSSSSSVHRRSPPG